MNHPLDEPTTLDRHDLPADPPNIPHRHPDTDDRPMAGFLRGAVWGALISALLLVAYAYWRSP